MAGRTSLADFDWPLPSRRAQGAAPSTKNAPAQQDHSLPCNGGPSDSSCAAAAG